LASTNDPETLPVEEDRLVRAAQKGDRQAFAVLAERYWDRLYRWLYHLTRDRHAAEDLVQETLLKAFAAIASFRAGTNLQAWLFRIAHNNWANHQRAASRARQPIPEETPAPGAGPVEQTLNRETLQLLARAVARLPNDFRAALLLRAEQGLSFRQMADILGVTEETARWRVFKARQKLMTVMAPQLDQGKP
jgi:RNA polymerase sigma-70 factor (ECF subfamily)